MDVTDRDPQRATKKCIFGDSSKTCPVHDFLLFTVADVMWNRGTFNNSSAAAAVLG